MAETIEQVPRGNAALETTRAMSLARRVHIVNRHDVFMASRRGTSRCPYLVRVHARPERFRRAMAIGCHFS
jgi:hypothetical protein